MKLRYASIIFAGLLVLNSAVLFSPEAQSTSESDNIVILSFDINSDNDNLSSWCQDLSYLLKQTNTNSIVFITGLIAEKHPECITSFHSGVDIGSQTYNFVDYQKQDHSLQIDDITKGKEAIESIGNLESKLFKTPHSSSDSNTKFLLNSAGIWADFSHTNQFNKYHEDELIKFDSVTYYLTKNANLPTKIELDKPKILTIDNTVPISEIEKLISDFKNEEILFFNASELTGLELTIRHEFQV